MVQTWFWGAFNEPNRNEANDWGEVIPRHMVRETP